MSSSERKTYSLAVLLGCLLLLTPVSWILQRLLPGNELLPVAAQELLLWLLPALLMRPWRTKRLGQKAHVMPLLLLALPLGVLCQIGGSGLRMLLPAAEESALLTLPESASERLLWLLVMIPLPAVCEEAFFRGCITVHLKDSASGGIALVLGTLFFALMHASPHALPAHLLISLICTMLMLSSGRVLAPMLAHFGFNAASLLMTLLPATPLLALVALLPLAAVVWQMKGICRHGNKMGTVDLVLSIILLAAMIVRYLI